MAALAVPTAYVATTAGPAVARPEPAQAQVQAPGQTQVQAPGQTPAAVTKPMPAPGADGQGSTRTIPLVPLSRPDAADRSLRTPREAASRGLPAQDVKPFSLLGVTWDDSAARLSGTVQVRTRGRSGGAWSAWQSLQARNEDGPDLGSGEGGGRPSRGSTAPLWVGPSDAVEVRVVPSPAPERAAVPPLPLPQGLRVDMVDPGRGIDPVEAGDDSAAMGAGAVGLGPGAVAGDGPSMPPFPDGGMADGGMADGGASEAVGLGPDVLPDPGLEVLPGPVAATGPGAVPGPVPGAGLSIPPFPDGGMADGGPPGAVGLGPSAVADERPFAPPAAGGQLAPVGVGEIAAEVGSPHAGSPGFTGPRPRIVTRTGWGADESLREPAFIYTAAVRAAFVHHTATGNAYTCAQAPAMIRSIYRYHVQSLGWRDIGYNFLIDKCGTIYEGRAGGVDKAVLGAHTLGFNSNSTGVAVLGTFTGDEPPAAAVNALSSLTAWKLGLSGANPAGTVSLVSGGGKYAQGSQVQFHVISGHRDGFATDCPGSKLYGKLGTIRSTAARLQGR